MEKPEASDQDHALIEQMLTVTEEDPGASGNALAGGAPFDCLADHVVQLFFTRYGEPFLHFDNVIF